MLFLLFALLDRWFAPAPARRRCDWLVQATYAHRGLHDAAAGRIENSPSAFAAAIAVGLGIECDVQRSHDGQAVVFHDFTLDRLTGETGSVGEENAARLCALHLADSGDTIPTLRGLLDQIAGRVPLLIEVKIPPGGRVAPTCLAVRRTLEGYGGPLAVMSFDPRVGGWFQRYSPHVVRGLVMTESGRRTWGARTRRHGALWRARPDFLAYDVTDLPSPFAAAQRRRGLPLLTWTVDSATRRDRATRHADAMIAEGPGIETHGEALA